MAEVGTKVSRFTLLLICTHKRIMAMAGGAKTKYGLNTAWFCRADE
ncbi:MAG: hypothetical protein AAB736_01385 [Patescibacteria group bacterium]